MALVLVASFLGAGAAHAAAIAVPGDAPTVAGPTAGGATAVAFVHGGQLCTALLEPGAPRPTVLTDENGSCDATPVLAPFSRTVLASRTDDAGRYDELGVVGGATASVAFKLGGQTVARAGTTPSPLPGAAAALRFYLIEADAQATSDEIALQDTFGTVQRAFDVADPPTGFSEHGLQAPPVGAGTIVAQGRRGTARWTLRTRIDHPLAGTPLLPERRVAEPCVIFAARYAKGREDRGDACDAEARSGNPIIVDIGGSCTPIGAHVAVLARAAVGRVTVVLGDGRRRTIALRPVPGAPEHTRAGVVVLGTGVAVRRVIATGAGGRTLSDDAYGVPPVVGSGTCVGGIGSVTITYRAVLPATNLGGGPHAPRVATDGVRLCLAIDRAPRPPGACALPPLDADDAFLDTQPTADGRYVAGFVPGDVTLARLALDDGSTRDVAATPVDGPYAASVRLVAADVPGTHRVVGYALLDAAGRTLATVDSGPEQPRMRHATVLLRRPGHGLPALTAAQIPARDGIGPAPCVVLGALTQQICGLIEPGYFVVIASCAPRQIVVLGLLHHATQRVAIRTAAGVEIAARNVPLPAALRRVGKGFSSSAAVTLAVLPAGAAPRRLLVRGPAANHADLALPPAREQCGYREAVTPGFEGFSSG